MADKARKVTGRNLAKRLGRDFLGSTGPAKAEVISDRLTIEFKTGAKFSGGLSQGLAQAGVNATDDHLPFLILHGQSTPQDVILVVMWLWEFEKLET